MAYTERTSLSSEPSNNWTKEKILNEALRRGATRIDELVRYLDFVFSQRFLNPEFVAIQSSHETDWWTSTWWKDRLNPAGIGITGHEPDNLKSKVWTNGRDSARAHLTHLALYHYGRNLPKGFPGTKEDDPRWDAAIQAGYDGAAHDIGDLTMTWAWDGNEPHDPLTYSEKIVNRLNRKAPDVATYTTDIPGLPGGPLVTNHPVKFRLIPKAHTRQRPGIKAARPRRSVQHGTGNPNSMAAGEARWLVDTVANSRYVSFHSTTDDKETWVMVPLDEVTYQAADGGGPGNMNGLSNESIENSALWNNEDRALKLIDNVANFMGGASARLGIEKPEQHWDFNYRQPAGERHDCPNKLRHRWIRGRRAWDIYVEKWHYYRKQELARMGGKVIDVVDDVVDDKEYAEPLVIEELKEVIEYNTQDIPVVTTHEGTDFTLVNDVVEATVDTPRLRWAADNAPHIGPIVPKGTRFIVRVVFRAGDGELYYLTPYWTRIKYNDTKQVSDAPSL